MEEEEEVLLACIPEESGHFSGSILKACHKCGQNVWVSPASLAAAGSKAKLVCVKCLGKSIANETIKDVAIKGMSEGQLREVSKAIGRKVTQEEADMLIEALMGKKSS